MASAYDFSFKTLQGDDLPLSAFTGRPMLVVNTASGCGFTPQLGALEALSRKFDQLVVIGVPCNDFGGQEPLEGDDISAFCQKNYGVTFTITAKEHCVGANAHPFFKWVVEEARFLAKPRWNFYKYLINKQGELEEWFSSVTAPDAKRLISAVELLFY
ncbi:glutathione peroxidase [Acidocella sp.]|jgi:glutathione peroxidase|uniref:glutathione peroxidase n=1 Tax=Acidocella sp. TaxID=50710 RepID=UPI0026197FC5|nr:glutathione peroxidase [Acidocella sp.]